MKPWTKSALKTALLTFAITLPLNLTVTETIISRQAERTVKPPPIEAPATTAREEIVTGLCTFGDCSVLRPTEVSVTNSTAAVKFPLTTVNSTEESTPSQVTANSQLLTEPDIEESTVLEVFLNSELLTKPEPEEEPATECHNDGYIGTFYITGYTAEEGFPEGSATASGYGVRPGYCAMNDSRRRSLGINYGDQIYVEGLGTYTVMDCGCWWGVVDIWVYTNAEAYSITGSYNVYLV